MALVDPKFDSDTEDFKKRLREFIEANDEVDADWNPYLRERVSAGVYYAGLNLNHDFLNKNEPWPDLDPSTIEFKQRLHENNPEAHEKPTVDPEMVKKLTSDSFVYPANYNGYEDSEGQQRYLNSYGVCDNIEQVLNAYDFESDPRKFCIVFVPMSKEHQPSEGGWRWHKWGPYIGTQNSQCEYLYDEPEVELVYCYHIYELLD